MGFQKGAEWKGNGGGRPKGATNRSSEMQKVNIQRMINEGLDYMIKLLEFSVPKLKSIDMDVKAEVTQKIEEIVININRSDIKNEN